MLFMPIPMALIGIMVAFIFINKKPVFSRYLLAIVFIGLGLSSFHPVADRLIRPLESYYATFDINQSVDVVVILGSGHSSSDEIPPAAQLNSSALFRLTEGMRILSNNPEAMLFVSGYAGQVDPRTHADVMQQVAISLGVAQSRIKAFPEPQDTEAEAKIMAPLLKGKPFALVSEAAHLPRAMRFYQEQGLDPIPAPAYRLNAEYSDWRIESRALYKTERAIYELLGQGWQLFKSIM